MPDLVNQGSASFFFLVGVNRIGIYAKLRTRLLRMFAEEYSILLKDDTELKNYLLTLAITTINKHLKSENKKRVSKLSF